MCKAKKKSRSLKSNMSNKKRSQYRPGDKKAREIKSAVILEQLYKLKREGLITEKEYENSKKQIFGP